MSQDGPAERHALVGKAELWEMKRRFQITFLRESGLQPHHRVLDIGCGTLRGGLPVIDYLDEGGYTGVDVRQLVIDEARVELRDAGLEAKRPDLRVVPDLGDVDLGGPFDVIWAFSVLIHLGDAELEGCFTCVDRHLADDGRFFGNVNATGARIGLVGTVKERLKPKWQGFPVVRHPVAWYAGRAAAHGLTLVDRGTLADLGHRAGRPVADQQRMLELTRAPGAS
jgi:predicted TPR repeat methyltransferase